MGCNLFQGKKERATRNSPLFSLILRCFLQKEPEKETLFSAVCPQTSKSCKNKGDFPPASGIEGGVKRTSFPHVPAGTKADFLRREKGENREDFPWDLPKSP